MIQIMISAWSGSKKRFFIFDLDQKSAIFFLIWIKKTPFHFWSGSKNLFFIFDPGSKNIHFWIKDHEIKKWSTVLIHDLPTVKIRVWLIWVHFRAPMPMWKYGPKKPMTGTLAEILVFFFYPIGKNITWFGLHGLHRSCIFRKIKQVE